jgi:hypothetical protein
MVLSAQKNVDSDIFLFGVGRSQRLGIGFHVACRHGGGIAGVCGERCLYVFVVDVGVAAEHGCVQNLAFAVLKNVVVQPGETAKSSTVVMKLFEGGTRLA